MRTTPPAVVAWGPCTSDRDWMMAREARAVAWVLNRCRLEGRGGVLRVPGHASHYTSGGNEAVRRFADAATIVTDRGSARGLGPTYVPWAYAPQIADAMILATGSSLVVTEHPAMPLLGWAMQLRAVDLSTGVVTVDTRSDQQRALIGQAVDLAHNGWRSSPGDRVAGSLLPELAGSGLTWAVFLGSALALDPRRVQVDDMLRVAPAVWKAERADLMKRLYEPE
jgi:hypothetical protein